MSTNRECSDQTAQMGTLIWTFAVRIWHKRSFPTLCITCRKWTYLTCILKIASNEIRAFMGKTCYRGAIRTSMNSTQSKTCHTPVSMAQSESRPTGDQGGQEIADSFPSCPATFFRWNFLLLFCSVRWFKKDSCQFLAKECTHVLVNCLED